MSSMQKSSTRLDSNDSTRGHVNPSIIVNLTTKREECQRNSPEAELQDDLSVIVIGGTEATRFKSTLMAPG